MHLFLSPHFDDVALSCGGQVAQLTQRGEKVVVFTVMAGDPPVSFQQTPFTLELHKRWALGPAPIAGRRLEDTIALKSLGADVKFGPYPDAIYRINSQGEPLYPNVSSIFGPVHAEDNVRDAKRAAVIQTLIALFSLRDTDIVHIPLGVGKHVDHMLVREMGKALALWRPSLTYFFYEDYPYAREHGEDGIRDAVDSLDAQVARTTVRVDTIAIEVKIAAISCYKSQLSSFWKTRDAMATEIRAYAQQVGGEREWRLLNDA